MKDPLTLVYNALWDLLEAWPNFADLVKLGNRVKFTASDAHEPAKLQLSNADLPEVRVIAEGMTPHIQRTSSSSTVIYRYGVHIFTGSKSLHTLYAVEWEVYRAMARWSEILTALTWNGKAFVVLARPTTVTDGYADNTLQRGIEGWASLWSCEVTMSFSTVDLQNLEV